MLTRPDEQTSKALARLSFNEDWRMVRSWLELNRAELLDRLEAEPDLDKLRRYQGASTILRSLMTTQDEAASF